MARRGPVPSSTEAEHRMRLTRRRDTSSELELRKKLWRLGLRYRVDIAPVPSLRYRADVVFPGARIAVFVDGCFWHGCPEHGTWPRANGEWWRDKLTQNIRRDRSADQAITAAGWTVVRVWEHDDPETGAHTVADLVAASSGRRASNREI